MNYVNVKWKKITMENYLFTKVQLMGRLYAAVTSSCEAMTLSRNVDYVLLDSIPY